MVAEGEVVLGGVRRGIEANKMGGLMTIVLVEGSVPVLGRPEGTAHRLAEVEGKSDTIWSRLAILRKREQGGSGPMYREEFSTRRFGPCV